MPLAIVDKPWESSWLGKPTFALALEEPLPSRTELCAALDALTAPCFVSARLDATDSAASGLLQDAGFRFIEAYLVLEQPLPADAAPDPRVRAAGEEDRESLHAIALTAFSYDRFHRDPQIDAGRADRSRMLWLENALSASDKAVYAALCDASPGGFLIARESPDGAHVLDLMAVSPRVRRRGLGRALTRHFLSMATSAGAAVARVGTQGVNTASLNLYTACGFRHRRASYTFHLHR